MVILRDVLATLTFRWDSLSLSRSLIQKRRFNLLRFYECTPLSLHCSLFGVEIHFITPQVYSTRISISSHDLFGRGKFYPRLNCGMRNGVFLNIDELDKLFPHLLKVIHYSCRYVSVLICFMVFDTHVWNIIDYYESQSLNKEIELFERVA